MSIIDNFEDHVRLLRRKTGADALNHPKDEFAVVDEFWVQILRSSTNAGRAAAGIVDLSPFFAYLPDFMSIEVANDRIEVLYSPTLPAGKQFRFLDVGNPGGAADFLEANLIEEIGT